MSETIPEKRQQRFPDDTWTHLAAIDCVRATASRCDWTRRRCSTTNGDAARLYERLGWVRVGDVPNFALMPRGEPCSTTYYYRDLQTPVTAVSSDTSKSSPDIRPAASTDFAAILELLKQLWPDQSFDLEKMSVAVGSQLKTPNHFTFCCEMSGRIVGFATMSIRHSLWQQAGIGYVGELIVHESDRGQGHGKALLDVLAEFAAARGCTRLELDSGFHRADSHAIYEHCGLIKRAFVFSRPLIL